jgi:hypothetical protein
MSDASIDPLKKQIHEVEEDIEAINAKLGWRYKILVQKA